MDEVKSMNSILLNAKYSAILDKQIQEKRIINLKNKKIEEKLYILGEYERLKDDINRMRMEKKLNDKKMEDIKEIEKQITLNKKLKEEHKQLLRKEFEENVKYQEQMKKEEIEKTKKEKQKIRQIVQEMLEENKKSLELKKARKLKEQQEEQKIIEYSKQKFLEEQNKIKELKELKHLKEIETAKLRETQKKLIDNKNIIDEIYTRREIEQAQRAKRQRSIDEAIRINKLKEEMKKVNDNLIELKKKKIWKKLLIKIKNMKKW